MRVKGLESHPKVSQQETAEWEKFIAWHKQKVLYIDWNLIQLFFPDKFKKINKLFL